MATLSSKVAPTGIVTQSNNLSDLANTSAALTNLGISNHDDITVDGSGNVGIGTSSPSRLLTLSSSDPRIRLEDTDQSVEVELMNNGGDGLLTTNGSSNIRLQTNNIERMRINAGGDLLVGCTARPSSSVTGSAFIKDTNGRQLRSSAQITTTFNHVAFYNPNGTVGKIATTGASTNYVTSSDYRLKTDVQPMTGATERLKALNPVNFEWIVDGTRVDGFLAHEAQEVVPEAVTGTKDAMMTEEYEVTPAVLDDDGNVVTEAVMGEREVPDYQGIDQSKLVPLLTAALQEAIGRIEALESKLTTLSE